MKRYIVCGGRDYDNYELIKSTIEQFPEDVRVVNGGCPTGADKHARRAGRELGRTVETYPANWEHYGRAAGPIRNRYMASLDDVEKVYAFPGGDGTKDMCKAADGIGIEVQEVS